jgi:hypothetical protein
VAETRGNPLALLELPRGLTPAELAGGFGVPDVPGLSGRIEGGFRRRIEELPPGPAGDKPDRGRRRMVQPLRIVDDAKERPLLSDLDSCR